VSTFFKPSDISVKECVVYNITMNGSAFAAIEGSDEQVYISPRVRDSIGCNVGDAVKAYCVDDHRPERNPGASARWNAVRATIMQRLEDAAVSASAAPVGSPVDAILAVERAWTVKQAAEASGIDPESVTAGFALRKAAFALIVSPSGGDPMIYYARTPEILVDLIDGVELGD